MNFKVVFYTIGLLLVVLGACLLLPLLCTMYYGEGDAHAFYLSAIITVFSGLGLAHLCKTQDEISNREGFAIVALSWVAFSLFGALPYCFSTPAHTYTDAFFETMSGFTTTGSSIFTNIEAHTKGLLFWRSITQWLGGMGIIVLSLAILPILGIGGMQLFKAEVPGPTSDKLTPRVKDTAKILWGVYVLLTALETILLMIAGMPPYEALCHSFTTLSSGGFSPKNTSINHYDSSAIHLIITFFMLCAGVNFSLHFKFLKGRFKEVFRDGEFKTYCMVFSIFVLFLFCDLLLSKTANSSPLIQLRDAAFTTASLLTTTGFATADYELWPLFSQFIAFLLMFIGGCAGSTGGGIKIIRNMIVLKFSYQQFYQLIHPKAILQMKIDTQVVKNPVLFGVLGFLVLYISSFAVGTLIMSGTGLDFTTAASATASCLGNIGPGLGSVGPTENFAHISTIGKWVLSFLMLLGRLELFTVLILFTPVFWKD
jgi:trk system potassium uptake protein TrkH